MAQACGLELEDPLLEGGEFEVRETCGGIVSGLNLFEGAA